MPTDVMTEDFDRTSFLYEVSLGEGLYAAFDHHRLFLYEPDRDDEPWVALGHAELDALDVFLHGGELPPHTNLIDVNHSGSGFCLTVERESGDYYMCLSDRQMKAFNRFRDDLNSEVFSTCGIQWGHLEP